MLEIFYYIFIYPLQSALGFVFEGIFALCGSLPLSIIFLSFGINIFLLKLTNLSDKQALKFNILQSRLNLKIKEFKKVFKGAELQSYIRTLYKQHHFHPVYALFSLGGLLLQIPFFISVWILFNHLESLKGASFLWIDDLSKADSIHFLGDSFSFIHILPILMLIFTLLNVYYTRTDNTNMVLKGKISAGKIQGICIAFIFFILLYDMPSSLVLYWTSNTLFALCKTLCKRVRESKEEIDSANTHNLDSIKITESNNNPKSTTAQSSSFVTNLFSKIFTPHTSLTPKEYLNYRNISILAIINIYFMICVFTPYAIYSSDVSQFDVSQTYQTLSALFGICLFLCLITIYITSFFYHTRLLKLGSYGVSVILCIGLVYTFVLDYNVITGESYSQMDNFVFKNPLVGNGWNKYVDLLVGILSCIIVLLLMFYSHFLKRVTQVVLVSIVVVSLLSLQSAYAQRNDILARAKTPSNQIQAAHDDIQKYLPPFHHQLTAFSKTEQNIIVLLFDGFSGSHLQIVFQQFPEFEKKFNGFIYYPNTVSLDGNTSITAHTILTGFKTSAFNQRNGSIEDFRNNASKELKNTYIDFRNAGFDVQSYGMPHLEPDKDLGEGISIYPTNWIFSSNMDYSLYYEKMLGMSSQLQLLRSQNRPIGELTSLGLFYFAPYVFRHRIYAPRYSTVSGIEFADYAWIFATDKMKNISFLSGINTTSQLPSIVRNLNTSAKGKTFKYIHTLYTHYPFVLDSRTCVPSQTRSTQLPKQYVPFLEYPNHYDNEICAIKQAMILIDYLKKESIYDNTMIILVSDHSYNDLPAHNMPYQQSYGNAPNPLLMIKEFNANKPLQVDSRLMSNADVYGILCDTLQTCVGGGGHDIRKNYPKSREIIHTKNIQWTDEVQRRKDLYFEKIWLVKDNVLNPLNFTDLTQQFKDGTLQLDEHVEH